MASDNDWYSDESDETFHRDKEMKLYCDLVTLNNGICAQLEEIDERIEWAKEDKAKLVKSNKEIDKRIKWVKEDKAKMVKLKEEWEILTGAEF